jgi:hypothetical protein
MNTTTRTLGLMALCCAASVAATAQQQTAPPTAPAAQPATPSVKPGRASAQSEAQSEAGEPRAHTSNDAATTTAPTTAPSGAPSAAPATSTGSAPATGRAPAARASSAGGTAAPGGGSGQKSASKIDRLDLSTATVTGDREQPKVMYIVPWKRSDIGDLAGKPMNSLVDEILAPVDRDVFKREVVYYNAVQADASQNGAQPKPGQQGEK